MKLLSEKPNSCRKERCSKCTCPSYGEIAEWLQCGEMGPAWAAGEMLQLHYLRPVLGPQVMVDLQFLHVTIYVRWRTQVQGLVLQGWVELVARALFHPATANLQSWITVCWTALKFVMFIAQKSRSHEQNEDYSKYILFFVSHFPHETNLASSFGLVTVLITMTFLIFFLLLWYWGLIFIF